MAVEDPVQLGLVGYGAGGRLFHAPFIEAAGIQLAGIVARAPERVASAREDWPDVPVYPSLGAMLDAGVDAVTITTPPDTHADLAYEAIEAGVHMVVDKPFVPSAAIARDLVDAADQAGVLLNVYQNRRWDADIQTLAKVISDGRVGDLWRLHVRMDQNNPATLRGGMGHGLLLDMGSHLVDQMLWLLGPVRCVTAHLDWRNLDEGRADVAFAIDLVHENGVTSYVESTKWHCLAHRELRVLGNKGSYSSVGTDVQEQAVLSGARPGDDPAGWGYEARENWGTLSTPAGDELIPSEQGRWQDFYSQFAAAVRREGPQPVPAVEAVRSLQVLEAARRSALEGATCGIHVP
jgi:predicted dehydrogenase